MHLIRGLGNIQPLEKGCVLTIGNFDGVHLGHQEVMQNLMQKGQEMQLPVVVMVFEPQPLEYFLLDNAPARLTRLREKAMQFNSLAIDHLLVVKFDRKVANYNASSFVKDVLVDKLRVKHVLIGDDFHFGKARRGNYSLLQEIGEQFGFSVQNTSSLQINGHRVSSTIIRDALGRGDLQEAAALLGRPYSVSGRVVHGDKRGRRIGFPTANIELCRKNAPIDGVFAVTLHGLRESPVDGVANVGTRPTFHGKHNLLLETHLLNFNRDIYGEYVEVQFLKKIRREKRFDSYQALQEQIQQDIANARLFFETA